MVDKQRTSISQIRKYLDGELDAKAMHQLEREAQDDPFLMDALEGYETAGKDQRDNLAGLSERLKLRVNKKEKSLIPWTAIGMAAGVAGFMIVAGLLYKSNRPVKTPQIAYQVPANHKAGKINVLPVITDSSIVAQPRVNAHVASEAPDKPVFRTRINKYSVPRYAAAAPPKLNSITANKHLKDSTPLDEMVVRLYFKQKDSVVMPQMVAVNRKPLSQSLEVKAKGVTISERQGKKHDNDTYSLGILAPKLPSGRLLTGTVVSRADGLPLPGVSVKVAGKTTATQTDANGKFALPAHADAKETVTFSYAGFAAKKVDINAKDSLKIELNEQPSALNEVMVTTPPVPVNADVSPVTAHPENGWRNYNRYLKDNAIVPSDDTAGAVKLKFTVGPDGSLSKISVVKGLSTLADEKAVGLIRNGPRWKANTNGTAEMITLTVYFEKKR